MGQYHVPVNLDRREYVHPHELGDGLKLMEQSMSGPGGTASALVMLLACSNGDGGRGGGDFHEEDPHGIVGRWAGDRIAIVGDYAEFDDLVDEDPTVIYDQCRSREEYDEVALEQRQRLWRMMADRASNAGQIEELKSWLVTYESQGPYENITPMVREVLSAEGWIKYADEQKTTGYIPRELAG